MEQWFEDARVTTAVTLLQREPDEQARMANVVRFIQLRKPLAEIYTAALKGPINESDEVARQADLDAVRDLIEEISDHQDTDYWRVHVVSQRELWSEGCRLPQPVVSDAKDDSTEDEPSGRPHQTVLERHRADGTARGAGRYKGGKWGQYVRAPDVWFDILETAGRRLVPLHELAEVRFGFKTGADKFFCVRDVTEEQLNRHPNRAEFKQVWGCPPSTQKRSASSATGRASRIWSRPVS